MQFPFFIGFLLEPDAESGSKHFEVITINPNNKQEVGRWVRKLIDNNRVHEFYVSPEWRKLRKDVLKEYKSECQVCKSKGFYSKADHVHHVQYLRNHPELALSRKYIHDGEEQINLLPVCKNCHETVCHPERLVHKKEPITEERW